MGLFSKILGGLFGGLFGGGKMPHIDIPQPTVRAQELVPSTTAPTPEAPELGATKNKPKGRKSLIIDRTQNNTPYNPTNM